ncbi:hypothetical protein EDC96DRAFT_545119 [Choanephora cucurbitarum]|nr:hypothetical protein EDC96DRAFT_545119 [Choanephora cucurbitarum]
MLNRTLKTSGTNACFDFLHDIATYFVCYIGVHMLKPSGLLLMLILVVFMKIIVFVFFTCKRKSCALFLLDVIIVKRYKCRLIYLKLYTIGNSAYQHKHSQTLFVPSLKSFRKSIFGKSLI